MKIKLFEKYEYDDSGDIDEEYAKEIISEYLDNLIDDKPLQEVFDKYCEELQEEERRWVLDSIQEIITNLRKEAFNIDASNDHYLKKKAKKYNI
jgi:hypothetical protein